MAVQGVFMSDSGIQGERVGGFASALISVVPTGTALLFALSSGMKSQDVGSQVQAWFEEAHISGRVMLTATYGSGDTVITVDDASSYVPGTFCMVEDTGEYLLVLSVTDNTLTVKRGFADTVPGALTQNTYVQRIGTAFEEASQRPTAVANAGYPVFNFTHIFRNAWSVSGTARAIGFHTGNKIAKNRKDASNMHAEDIERSLLWSRKQIYVKDGQPLRTMDGVLTQLKTNVVAAGATTNYADIMSFMQSVFSRNIKGQPNERIAFCGNHMLGVLNEIARIEGTINIQPGETSFGLNVYKWITPYGSVSLMTHPLMVESPLWTKDLYVLHPGSIVIDYLRRTEYEGYDSAGLRAGVDADYGIYTTELTVEYHAEVTGGKLLGVNEAAAVS